MPLDVNGELEKQNAQAERLAAARRAEADMKAAELRKIEEAARVLGREAVEALRSNGVPQSDDNGWRLPSNCPWDFVSTGGVLSWARPINVRIKDEVGIWVDSHTGHIKNLFNNSQPLGETSYATESWDDLLSKAIVALIKNGR